MPPFRVWAAAGRETHTTPEPLITWLQAHPAVTIVVRDRAGRPPGRAYLEGRAASMLLGPKISADAMLSA